MSYISHINRIQEEAVLANFTKLYGNILTDEWAAKVRKDHGERIAARNAENGKQTYEG